MAQLTWDDTGERRYETGVSNGVLYLRNQTGEYDTGFAWNGLISVAENPSGAEATPLYADNIKYLNLVSSEQFGATVEAYTYPDEFAECDGSAQPEIGVYVGQQTRSTFGLSYKTKVGTDVSPDAGYKIHLVYGALAAPSAKTFTTVNETPDGITFSWEVTTTPVAMTGQKPTATLVVDSTKASSSSLLALEELLYGTSGTDPQLPLPDDVMALFAGTVIEVVPVAPTYDSGTHTLTIPSTAHVIYKIDGEIVVAGAIVITVDTVVTAEPESGYKFPTITDDDWFFDFV